MRHALKGAVAAAFTLVMISCGPPSSPPGSGNASPLGMGGMGGANGDPIGFLLETRDSLHLPDSIATQLVRLNLRLYSRNAEIQMAIDTTLRAARFDPTTERDSTKVPAELRQRLDPLIAQRRAQTAAARDTAYAMLTPAQRDSARVLFDRMLARRGGNQRRTPDNGRPPGEP